MDRSQIPSERNSEQNADSDALALLGKKQVLKRRFGLVSIFGFAMAELITWETTLALFSQAFENGGPVGVVYGFLIAWLSSLSVYVVISELASMAPIAGGQYYWVYMLAPQRWKKSSSYLVGWLTSLAWIATVATETIFAGSMLQGIIILDTPSYESKPWQGTLLAWLVIVVAVLINVVIPGALPKLETFGLVFHSAGFVAIMSVLWVYSPIGTAEFVFTTSRNEGGWPSQGLSYCVGFLGNVATFVGADASVHMAEEISNAAVNIPRAICGSMIFNGFLGLAMLVTILFCIGDVDSVANTTLGFEFIQVFINSTKSVAGATVMTAVVLILTWLASTGIITTASRMTWSFARDRGAPFSSLLSKVSKRTHVPVVAVCFVCFLAALLTVIYAGSSVTFNDVVSLTITGFYGSYFLPAAFLLYHRIKGHVAAHGFHRKENQPVAEMVLSEQSSGLSPEHKDVGSNDEKAVPQNSPDIAAEIAQVQLAWGPFHIPGILGIVNNTYACVYMIFVIFFSVWPPATPVTAQTMNYSIVVTSGVLIFSGIWYWVRGRKEYNGPLIDDDVKALMGAGNIPAVQ